jgi:hypothetical protein
MKALGLTAFTIYFVFLAWLWCRQWRQGAIRRFPSTTVHQDSEPGRFKFWTAVHGILWLILVAVLMAAWWALFTGNLK